VAETSGAAAGAPPSRGLVLLLVIALRWLAVAAATFLSLLALGWLAGRLAPDLVPKGIAAVFQTGVDLLTELLVLLTALAATGVILTALRRWERQTRAARYRAWARGRQEADRERAEAEAVSRADAMPAGAVEAILVVDLIQSTELIREHGDAFFRDLLRRIETAFIPVARRYRTRGVDGHGDGFLFCFGRAEDALAALREMYGRLPAINKATPGGVDVAFRASLHVGPTFTDTRGNRSGLTVLKTVRLNGVMEMLQGRGAGRNSLVVSEEASAALESAGVATKLLGHVSLRGFPGTHPAYQIDV
jgi:class 3 adenylate cyclase